MSAQSSQDKYQTGNQSNQSNPWSVQAPYLSQAFQAASGAFSKAGDAAAPSNFVAQFTPDQLAAYGQMVGYGTGNSAIPGSSAAAGGALTGAGANATQAGLFGLANFNPATSGDIMRDASTFSNNPQIQGMVDAATRDAKRAVYEGQLPQIDRNAAATGNINSSRTGAMDAIALRGLGDTVADTSANIRGNAYNTGLSSSLNLASLAQSGQLGALSGLVSGGTGAVGAGVGANSGAVAQQGGLFDIANAGISGQQQGAQAALNDALARYQSQVNSPFDPVKNYYNLIGANNWGGTSSGTNNQQGVSTNNPSTMAQIGQGVGILSSLFQPKPYGY